MGVLLHPQSCQLVENAVLMFVLDVFSSCWGVFFFFTCFNFVLTLYSSGRLVVVIGCSGRESVCVRFHGGYRRSPMMGLGRSSRGGVMILTDLSVWVGVVFGFLASR